MSAATQKSGSPAFTPTLTEGTVVTIWYTDPTQNPRLATVQRCDGLGLTANYDTGFRTVFHPWHTIDQVALGDVLKEEVRISDFPEDSDDDPEGEDVTEPFGAALAQAMSPKASHFFTSRKDRFIRMGTLVSAHGSGFVFIHAGTKKEQHYDWDAASAMGVMKVGK